MTTKKLSIEVCLRGAMVLGLILAVGAGGCELPGEDHDEACDEPEAVGEAQDELSSLSCQMTTATGYKNGSAFQIQVVKVDGKKVEWKTANAYMKMAKAAAEDGIGIHVVSGFWTYAEQQYL